MKLVTISSAALIATAAFSGAAHAQTFDGPYVGAQAGWSQNQVDSPTTDLGIVPVDASSDSVLLGGYAGYDKQLDNIVIGAEFGVSLGTDDSIVAGAATSRVSIDPKQSFDLTARAGYLVTPDTLVYGRGGYTNDRIRSTLTTLSGPVDAAENRDGWLVGGGVERKLTSNLSARLEYRYADLSDGDGKYDRNQFLTGIAFRF